MMFFFAVYVGQLSQYMQVLQSTCLLRTAVAQWPHFSLYKFVMGCIVVYGGGPPNMGAKEQLTDVLFDVLTGQTIRAKSEQNALCWCRQNGLHTIDEIVAVEKQVRLIPKRSFAQDHFEHTRKNG